MAASSVLKPYALGFDGMRDPLATAHMMLTPDHTGSELACVSSLVRPSTPPSTPPPPVVLDHLSYPHIMDLIIAYAPDESRIALRAASRTYKHQMDKLLCSHIKINNRVVLSHFVAPFYRGKIPGLRFNGDDVSMAERDECLRLLHTHCRVVDYYRSVGLLYRDRDVLAPALANVRLVRRQDPVLCQIRTPAVVDFLIVSPRSMRASWFAPLAVGLAPIPEGATTMIVSVIFHPHHPRFVIPRAECCISDSSRLPDCQLNIVSFARYLERVVVILTPRTEGLPPAPPAAMNLPRQRLGLLCGVVDAMSLRIPDVQFTLVGLDELDPLWLGLPPATSQRDREAAVLDAIEAEWVQWRPSELQRGVRAQEYIEFVSRDEYKRRIGPYEYDLHTIED